MSERPLRVAVIGCGTGGPAAALLLHRDGHHVEVFERVAVPGPVGAGFLLQPTGVQVLAELGLAERVLARSSKVNRLYGTTVRGRPVLDLHYDELARGLCGFGVHRGVIFGALLDALATSGIGLHAGVEVTGASLAGTKRVLTDARGGEHGPFDLVVVADGARSKLRTQLGFAVRRDRTYPWGALWFMGEDRERIGGASLRQGFDGTRTMAGLLPTGWRTHDPLDGPPRVSLFWSLARSHLDTWRANGLAAWKAAVMRVLPLAESVLAQIDDASQLTFAAYQDVQLAQWHIPGAIVLGDAAHAMSPQLGQGVNLALTDASTLARVLRDEPLGTALASYSRTRRAHLGFYQWATRFLTPFFQSRLVPLGWARDAFMGPMCAVPLVRRQMLLSMAGVHQGFLTAPRTLGGLLGANTG